MTAAAFDPEVQALLEEIVTDPNSTLLKVPEAPLSKWLAKREPPVSTGEAFLTRAERYLLQEYREEAACLLLDSCVSDLLSKPLEETRIHRHVTGGFTLEPLNRSDLSKQADRLTSSRAGSNLKEPLELLRQETNASRLASASLRLAPRDEARIWMALALHHEGHPQSAIRILLDVLGHHPTRMNELYAREDCGFVMLVKQNYETALEWYRSASLMPESGSLASMSWMLSAFQIGARSEAAAAARRVEDTTTAGDAILCEFEMIVSRLTPTPACRKLARALSADLSPIARRIADVLA